MGWGGDRGKTGQGNGRGGASAWGWAQSVLGRRPELRTGEVVQEEDGSGLKKLIFQPTPPSPTSRRGNSSDAPEVCISGCLCFHHCGSQRCQPSASSALQPNHTCQPTAPPKSSSRQTRRLKPPQQTPTAPKHIQRARDNDAQHSKPHPTCCRLCGLQPGRYSLQPPQLLHNTKCKAEGSTH